MWSGETNIKGPKGDKGDQGVKGDKGDQGVQGLKGDTGATGADSTVPGPPNTLAIGTVTTVAPGGAATSTITGASPNQTLNLGIPSGVQGPKGDKGDQGDPGAPGAPGSGAGDVVGPASATNDHITLFNGPSGKVLKDSGRLLSSLETALQGVDNYDTFPFADGSFFSTPGAVNPPPGSNYVAGICYGSGLNATMLEARDLSGTPNTVWYRSKVSGVWSAWSQGPGAQADLDTRYVNVSGDTVTGPLHVSSTLGVTSDITGGGALFVTGNISGHDVFASRSSNTGYLFLGSDSTKYLGYDGASYTFAGPGKVSIADITASTSPSTGALTVAGGAGITGDISTAGKLVVRHNGTGAPQTSIQLSTSYGTVGDINTIDWDVNWSGTVTCRIGQSLNASNEPYLTFWTSTAYNVAGREVMRLAGADGKLSVLSTTASTSPSTGALTVAGGVGVAGKLNSGQLNVGSSPLPYGASFKVATNQNLGLTSGAGGVTFLALTDDSSAYVPLTFNTGLLTSTGAVFVNNGTASTSPATGALTVAGGVGVGGALYANNIDVFDGTINGRMLPFGGNLFLGTTTNHGILFQTNNAGVGSISPAGVWNINNTTASSSPTTGALTVAGGLGVAGAISCGGGVAASVVQSAASATTGYYYFGNSGTKSLSYDGTNFNFTGGALVVGQDIFAARTATTGYHQFGTSGNKFLGYDGTNFNFIGGPVIMGTGSGYYPVNACAVLVAASGGSTQYGLGVGVQTDNTTMIVFSNSNRAQVGSIGETVNSVVYNTASSADLKEDLKSFDAGNIIDQTNVYDFAWKSTGERSYGVIAQQAVEVYPLAVTHSQQDGQEDDFWGVDYSKYVPVLLQELKALRARVAQLEERTDIGAKPSHV